MDLTILTADERRALKDEAKREAWFRGDLRWKLHDDQKPIYDQIGEVADKGGSRFVMEIARRWGKTWMLAVLACEACLNNPGQRVVFGAPSLKHLQEFILPTFEAVTRDAPQSCKPVFNTQSGHWTFPNRAWIHLFGADDKLKASRGRGADSILNIFDEAGFSPVLDYVLDDVFKATTMHSGGMTILGSTPSDTPDHPFTVIAERAEQDGYYAQRTIHDNPRLTKERIEAFIAEGALEQGLTVEEYVETDTFRREYLAERCIDKRLVVLPEWEKAREKQIQALPRPEFFNGQTILDPGGVDPHAIHFAYWDFPRAVYVVEDELLLRNGENSTQMVAAIQAKEKALWGTKLWNGTLRGATDEPTEALLANIPDFMRAIVEKALPHETQPFARWSDTNIQLVRDLYELHGVAFIPTAKDNKELQVNNLRVKISAGQVFVHPRCTNTDRHWRGTTWKDHKRKDFARKAGEHGDLVDTGCYGVRNLDKRNPEPAGWRLTPDSSPKTRALAMARDDARNAGRRAVLNQTPLGRKIAKRHSSR